MSINKYTTQEVLNKVYTDASDNTISLQSQTAKETLNAVLSSGENSLNVSLAGSNTITGDVTISGDLTVQGSNTNTYDEIVNGDLHIKSDSGNSTSAFLIEQNDGTDVFVVDSQNSRVSIGASTSNFPLTVKAPTSSDTAIAMFENQGTSSPSGIYVNLSGATPNDRTDYYFFASGGGGDVSLFTDGGASFAGKVDISSAQNSNDGNLKILSNNNGSAGLSFYNTNSSSDHSRKWMIHTNFSDEGTFEIVRNTTKTNTTNVTALTITKESNVGIGTTSPATALHINDTSGNAHLRLDSGGSYSNIYANSNLYLQPNGSTAMTLLSGGNVGIGTTSPSSYNDHANQLVVASSTNAGITIVAGTSSASKIHFADGTGNNSSYRGYINYTHSDGSLSDYFAIGAGAATRMVIDTNSRISLSNNDGGAGNTVFGYNAGNLIGSGDNYNVFIGHNVADADMTNATENVGMGYGALSALTEGDSNITIGYSAGETITTSSNNILIGARSGNLITTGASGTVAIGTSTLTALTSGARNLAIGFESGSFTNTGADNTFIGYRAGSQGDTYGLTTGGRNVALGSHAFGGSASAHITGSNNTALGAEALLNAQGAIADNTAVGQNALYALTTGGYNVAIGSGALDELPTGSYNTAVGYQALHQIDGGETNNTAIGYLAGANADGNGEGTFVGANTSLGTATDNDNVIIGESATGGGANSIVIGADATGQSANSVTLGNAFVTAVYMAQDKGATVHAGGLSIVGDSSGNYVASFQNDGNNENRHGLLVQGGADDASGTTFYLTCRDGDGGGVGYIANTSGTFALTDPSDRRLKKDIVDTSIKGLETVEKMKVRDFEWKQSGDKCTGGFIAQELKEVFAPAVQGTDGEMESYEVTPRVIGQEATYYNDEDEIPSGKKVGDIKTEAIEGKDAVLGERIVPMGVSRDVLVPVLVKAIQELSAKVTELESKL